MAVQRVIDSLDLYVDPRNPGQKQGYIHLFFLTRPLHDEISVKLGAHFSRIPDILAKSGEHGQNKGLLRRLFPLAAND